MFSEINAKLIVKKGDLRKKEKYTVQLADYQKELEVMEETVSQLQTQLDSETEDIEKLERMGLTNLLATLSGTKEEKLSKEKQDLVVAKHKLEEAEKTRKEIERALIELSNKLQDFINAEDEYQQLLLQKENLVKTSTSPFAAKVFELSEQEGGLKAYLTELDEAIAAGERVERSLHDAIKSLDNAETWGTLDIFGGGTLTGMVKHQHIDKAETFLHKAQSEMRQFQKELLDVRETAFPEINISGMLKFADFFFDGFIADFMVQGKIQRSLEQAKNQYDKVTDILMKLKLQSEGKNKELETIHQKKLEVIEKL
jgi:DNA repair exonuclease SbcCD ATPase subunit